MREFYSLLKNEPRPVLLIIALAAMGLSAALYGSIASLILIILGTVVLPGAVIFYTFSDLDLEDSLLLGIPVGAAVAGGLATLLAYLSILNPVNLATSVMLVSAPMLLLRKRERMEFTPTRIRVIFVALLLAITGAWVYPHLVSSPSGYPVVYLETPEGVAEGENFTIAVNVENHYSKTVEIWLNLTYGQVTDNRSLKLEPGEAAREVYTLTAVGGEKVRVDVYVDGEYYGTLSWSPLSRR